VFEHLLRRYEPSPQEVLEVLELHQLSLEFRQEQHYREALDAYCDEYYRLAEQHQQEFAAMQNEPDIFALFYRRRGND
jgi:predicted component of type VI protein secretion system